MTQVPNFKPLNVKPIIMLIKDEHWRLWFVKNVVRYADTVIHKASSAAGAQVSVGTQKTAGFIRARV